MIVGYNDLFHTIPQTGTIVRTQIGEYWDFTCKRKLTGQVIDVAAVNGTTEEPDSEEKTIVTEFDMDIMCCDPDEKDCKQVSTLTMIPSIYLCFSVLLTQPLSFVLVQMLQRIQNFLSI